MADNYLGEFPLDDLSGTKFGDYTPVNWAMYFIGSYGQIDGDHHKLWVLDQVARILKGTPIIVKEARWGPSDQYPEGLVEYREQTGEPSQEYLDWVAMMRGDINDDGDYEYFYEEGIAP